MISRLIMRSFGGVSFKLWVAIRLAVSFVLALGGMNPLGLAPPTILGIVGITFVLSVVEIRRHREQTILASLGFSPAFLYSLLLLPPSLGEFLLWAAGSLVK